MIRGRNFKHSVELFKAVQVLDAYSMPTTTFVSLGSVPAAVKVLNGSRAMYYQEVGVTNPIQIEIRNPGTTEIAKIIWLGYEIIPRSVLPSDQVDGYEERDRGKFLVIEGSFKVLTTTTSTTTTTTTTHG